MIQTAHKFLARKAVVRLLLTFLGLWLNTVSGAVIADAHSERKPTVAVLYFDYSGRQSDLAELQKGLAQMLISDLSASNDIQIVERDRLEAVLSELHLARTAKLDPSFVNRIGRLLGARYLILGGYFSIGTMFRIDARIVEVETGRVVASCFGMGKQEEIWAVEQQVGNQLLQKIGENLLENFRLRTAAPNQAYSQPPHVTPKTIRDLSHALDALDKGDTEHARLELQRIAPGFRPAAERLDRLIQ